jgi:hypothetical protein
MDAAELTLLARLYFECCQEWAASRNSPLSDDNRLCIAKSLIRLFQQDEHDPKTMKDIALMAAGSYRKASLDLSRTRLCASRVLTQGLRWH